MSGGPLSPVRLLLRFACHPRESGGPRNRAPKVEDPRLRGEDSGCGIERGAAMAPVDDGRLCQFR
ncbi:hypothetical protein NBRC116599_08060 [Aquicoccus sp. SU-CL01552]